MTKTIFSFFLLVFFIPFTVFSQKGEQQVTAPEMPVNPKTGLITFTGVIEVEGANAAKLFDKALAWANGFYKNPGNVIREKDKTQGKIICKARYRLSNPPDKKGTVTSAGDAMYKLTIELKDGRYRYTISELNWMKTSAYPIERWLDDSSASYKSVFVYYLQQSDATMKKVAASLQSTMLLPDEAPEDDW
jgi:uncharacterized protein with TBP-like fold DUF4468